MDSELLYSDQLSPFGTTAEAEPDTAAWLTWSSGHVSASLAMSTATAAWALVVTFSVSSLTIAAPSSMRASLTLTEPISTPRE